MSGEKDIATVALPLSSKVEHRVNPSALSKLSEVLDRGFKSSKEAFFDPNHGWKTTHFWGPVANWGIMIAGLCDLFIKGDANLMMGETVAQMFYSLVFMLFAWRVSPRNYLLLLCHLFNESIVIIKIVRIIQYSKSSPKESAIYYYIGVCVAVAGFIFGRFIESVLHRCSCLSIKVKKIINHEAGIFTVFFWAPLGKLCLAIPQLIDYRVPLEKISGPMQIAYFCTGLIWTRYCFVTKPKTYFLATINFTLALTSIYHIVRKYVYDFFPQ